MNRSALKKYAPQARLDFIEAVTLRARRLGLDPALPVRVEHTGDVLLVGGQPFSASIANQRSSLVQRIHQQGFAVVVEALAYTWFNRLVAIRFMELKGYLGHGYRVLSHPQGQQPEILDNVQHLDLPGLDNGEVIRLKTAGNQDEVLYREILLAQCHELHRNMPFLFEALDDATELLLPDNLLRTDSPISRLVNDIDEADWKEVEIIGWLYQYYISEKKDEVMGKVVKSEDIPAATQLFTPNWIVQYLVQNSLGRLWLMANPGSRLKEKMPYYIEPVEQTPEVQAQLDTLIKIRMDQDGGTLNPESLTVLDPACGSGHILVEAYNLLRAIYEERGYRLRDIPRLILQKNLYGLDIDDRAAQLAGFAILMKAREDDRRLFDDEQNPPQLNVMAIQQSRALPDDEIAQAIMSAAIEIEGGEAFHTGQLFGGNQLETHHSSGVTVLDLRKLIQLFEHGKTFGSLINLSACLKNKLSAIVDLLAIVSEQADDLSRNYAVQILAQFALPATVLARQYDAVTANPPYMGGRNMNELVKKFIKVTYSESRADIYAAFIERGFQMAKETGIVSMVTMETWMFLSSYEEMRESTLSGGTVSSLVHMPYEGKGRTSMGINFGTSAFSVFATPVNSFVGEYQCIRYTEIDDDGVPLKFPVLNDRYTQVSQDELKQIPGSPIAYWVSESTRQVFTKSKKMSDVAIPRQGLATGDNDRFVRFWHEVDFSRIGFGFPSGNEAGKSQKKWFPHQKGGDFRKWYGNEECVVDWEGDGQVLRNFKDENGKLRSRPQSTDFYFKECVSWSDVTSSSNSFRWHDQGFIPNVIAPVVFKGEVDLRFILLAANNAFFNQVIKALNPTLHFHVGYFSNLPFPEKIISHGVEIADELISIARDDWNGHELSWGFLGLNWSALGITKSSLRESWELWQEYKNNQFELMIDLETKNNSIFIEEYELSGEIQTQVPRSEITLFEADRVQDCKRLVSYAIGCIMGRYSLDEPGLVYAHSGSVGFDPSHYIEFPADSDGIIPITDESWFEDDAGERMREFVKVVWKGDSLVENIEWLADSLGRKAGESAGEAIRRYLSTSFYKDHLQTYKKRPIYWLFSSGKQKAFECLVYLHRYNEGTLSRMRMEYVVPLQSRMQARIDKLTDDISSATSSAQQKALQKRKEKFTKQLEELRRFDETLRPYADQRITLDLDEGVKANYGKFGDLLAEVKAITGS